MPYRLFFGIYLPLIRSVKVGLQVESFILAEKFNKSLALLKQ